MKKKLTISQNIYLGVKTFFDPIIALFLMVATLPLWIFIIIRIKLDSKGPVFVPDHLRVGKNKKTFHMYKFRTMYDKNPEHKKVKKVNEEMTKDENSTNITKFGKLLRSTDLDELPQLLNVIKGEMFFVGPRCFLVEEASYYKKKFPNFRQKINLRTQIKPGITGLWQVSGRDTTTLEERLDIDTLYIRTLGPFLDIKIIFLTLSKLITRKWHL